MGSGVPGDGKAGLAQQVVVPGVRGTGATLAPGALKNKSYEIEGNEFN